MVSRLGIETDVVKLLPKDAPYVADFQYFSRNFGISDTLVFLVRGNANELAPKVEALENWLKTSDWFTSVERATLPGTEGGTLLLAFTREPAMNQEFCETMLPEVRRYLEETETPAELTGQAAFVTEGRASVWRDSQRTGLIAFALILCILIFSFGDPIFPFVAMVPLGIGIIWCLAFAQAVFGRVSFLTAALPTALLGIGIDYALHLRSARLELEEDRTPAVWRRVFSRVGPPLLLGALTTVAAFFALVFARIRALSHMGYVGAAGLAMIFLVCIFTAPVLLDWRDRLGVRFRPLPTAWLGRLAHGALRHRFWTITGFALVTVPLLVLALRLRISVDPNAYANPNLPSHRLREELAEKMNLVLEPILIATEDLAAERRVLNRIRDLVGPGKPFSVVNCLSNAKLRALTRIMGLISPGKPLGLLNWLSLYFTPTGPDAQERRFIGKDGHLCMVLYPSFNPYEGKSLPKLVAAVDTIKERCKGDILRYSGPSIIVNEMFHLVKKDLRRTGLIAGGTVFVMLVLLMRRPRYFLSAMVPLAGGVTWMLGIMQLSGQQFTAANVMAMPLVLGLGVDYGVHIVHRLRSASVAEAVSTTGRAILVASATTAAAFFSLCLASNPAVAGMGLAGAIGILSCLVWSLVFLPALLGRPAGYDDQDARHPCRQRGHRKGIEAENGVG